MTSRCTRGCKKYENEHTKKWSARVSRSDAWVFVTYEYNFKSNELIDNSAQAMLDEFYKWTQALKPMRAPGQ